MSHQNRLTRANLGGFYNRPAPENKSRISHRSFFSYLLNYSENSAQPQSVHRARMPVGIQPNSPFCWRSEPPHLQAHRDGGILQPAQQHRGAAHFAVCIEHRDSSDPGVRPHKRNIDPYKHEESVTPQQQGLVDQLFRCIGCNLVQRRGCALAHSNQADGIPVRRLDVPGKCPESCPPDGSKFGSGHAGA